MDVMKILEVLQALLSNIVLNELEWGIASQWVDIPHPP